MNWYLDHMNEKWWDGIESALVDHPRQGDSKHEEHISKILKTKH